jgi:hypothetical protein
MERSIVFNNCGDRYGDDNKRVRFTFAQTYSTVTVSVHRSGHDEDDPIAVMDLTQDDVKALYSAFGSSGR